MVFHAGTQQCINLEAFYFVSGLLIMEQNDHQRRANT